MKVSDYICYVFVVIIAVTMIDAFIYAIIDIVSDSEELGMLVALIMDFFALCMCLAYILCMEG